MSRIILKLNDDDHRTERVVVGWDRPLQTFFWQVFAPEPPTDPDTGFPDYSEMYEEMEGYGGYVPREIERAEYLATWPGIPDEVKDLIDDEVLKTLHEHCVHQDTMYNDVVSMLGDRNDPEAPKR
jgi:hypothetical protein